MAKCQYGCLYTGLSALARVKCLLFLSLLSSVTVGQGRGVPVWRMRRRRRKRRQLRAEKEVCLPTTAPQNSSSELESSETEGELWGTERESELQGTERESELRGTERESELRGTERESELRGTERESELQGTERERTGGGINLRAEEDENKISAQFQETTEIGGGSVAMETGVAQKRAVFVQLDRPAEVQVCACVCVCVCVCVCACVCVCVSLWPPMVTRLYTYITAQTRAVFPASSTFLAFHTV